MEPLTLFWLCAAAVLVAMVAVASGFGLGTTLTPLFLLAVDVKSAIFLVAIIHFANSLFRLALFRGTIDSAVVRRFGLLSLAGALLGSLLQKQAANPVLEIALGVLLIVLGGNELLPRQLAWRIPRRLDQLGGFLSGLLGGVLGNQGALRSAYLLNYNLSKEAFIATGTAIACLIDASRIPVYWFSYGNRLEGTWPYLLVVIGAAFLGTLLGRRLVRRLKLDWFRRLVAGLIVATGGALILLSL